ncbi:SH3 domain-binding glutamic acid-rich protein-like protein [Smittium culicis]|uniref:SH3 domain-binding glutamic acid-rich protein-like protein n=1 Tax=Smittium culicis TaxID=133412 RepID=A0A1R1YI32_9FUNG|nr:SH3 domain-binding glutamic acid-rich protein-like protein [Smittium culicis]
MDSTKTFDSDELDNSTITEFESCLALSSETQEFNVDKSNFDNGIPKALFKSDDTNDVQNKTVDEHKTNTKSEIAETDHNENVVSINESVISKPEINNITSTSDTEIVRQDIITEKDYVIVKKSSEAPISDADINVRPIISNTANKVQSIESGNSSTNILDQAKISSHEESGNLKSEIDTIQKKLENHSLSSDPAEHSDQPSDIIQTSKDEVDDKDKSALEGNNKKEKRISTSSTISNNNEHQSLNSKVEIVKSNLTQHSEPKQNSPTVSQISSEIQTTLDCAEESNDKFTTSRQLSEVSKHDIVTKTSQEKEKPIASLQKKQNQEQQQQQQQSEQEPVRVKIYGSTVSGNRKYKSESQHLFNILNTHQIKYEFICIAADQQAKSFIKRKSLGSVQIPQIYVDDELVGFYDGFIDANEHDELEHWLRLDQEPLDF